MSDHPELRTEHPDRSSHPGIHLRGFLTALRRSLFLLPILATGFPHAVRAQDQGPSTEGALFLLLPVTAKAVGLSRAVTALPGPEAVWWNPAGLAEVREGRGLLYRGDHPVGPATAGSVLLTHRLASLGLSYQLIDLGSDDVTDIEGVVVGRITTRNHVGIVSLASRVAGVVGLGMNVKLVQFQVSCRGQCQDAGVTTTSVAFDVGAQMSRVAGIPLRLGAMVAHAGPDFGPEQAGDPLPTRVRVAAAYEVLAHFLETEELALTLAAELEDQRRNSGSPATYLGAEFTAGREDALSIRAGYVLGAEQQLDGASVGVGLHYQRFDVGLAKSLASSPSSGQSEPIHISFGFLF